MNKIKRYLEFLSESEEQSLGQWIESVYDDEYVKNIVSRYVGEFGTDIRLSNAVNLLDDNQKAEMRQLIEDYLENGIEDKEPTIMVSTDIEPLTEADSAMGGKGVFTSFLKTLTALGQRDIASGECPDDFLLFYASPKLETQQVKQVFFRFRSLRDFVDDVKYTENELVLYYGLKCDGKIEYGAKYEEGLVPFGGFKLNQSARKWINSLELKALFPFKKELVNLTVEDLMTLGSIKSDMSAYSPGYTEGKAPVSLSDRIITFGYQGVGRWDNGKLDQGEYDNLKSNFVNWMSGRKWAGKVLISLKAGSYWLWIHIKLK
jgi:hypothetical protein